MQLEKSSPEALYYRWPETLRIEYEQLLRDGDPASSTLPFTKETATASNPPEDCMEELEGLRLDILMKEDKGGFGYVATSQDDRRGDAVAITAYVAESFRTKTPPVQTTIIPIDEFYRFKPEGLSLVYKTTTFDAMTRDKHPDTDRVIILTGFPDSSVFDEQTLQQIPTQENAGLVHTRETELGRYLSEFAKNILPSLMKEKQGDIIAVLQTIVEYTRGAVRDAKLLLATALLLQDCQLWQNLVYEGREKGTPLFIVAPLSFHDAMNRINEVGSHSGRDYWYRASMSLGAIENLRPDTTPTLPNAHNQGLSAGSYRDRIQPLLSQLLTRRVTT
jgi:hypothetical protein